MVPRPPVPNASNRRNSKLLVLWYEYAVALENERAAQQPAPPVEVPPVVVPVLGAPLVLSAGVVYFNDGMTPAGYSGGVQVLAEPGDGRPYWRQTTAAGSWDWVVASNEPADFVAGHWEKVSPLPTKPPPVVVEVPPQADAFSPDRLHAAHLMAAFIKSAPDKAGYCRQMIRFAKAHGQNGSFVFSDDIPFKPWDAKEGDAYYDAVSTFLDVAFSEAFPVIPQVQAGFSAEAYAAWFARFADSPAILSHDGKPVFALWNWKRSKGVVTNDAIAKARQLYGKPVVVMACCDWYEVMAINDEPANVWTRFDKLIAQEPQCDGWLNFVVGGDWNDGAAAAVPKIVAKNANMVNACRKAGKLAMPGWAAAYHDRTPRNVMTDDALRTQWQGILASASRWATLSTANDDTELSGINYEKDAHFHDAVRSLVDLL